MRFLDLAATSAAVAAVSARRSKIDLLATALRGLAPDEIEAGAAHLSGQARQREVREGGAGRRGAPPPGGAGPPLVGRVPPALGPALVFVLRAFSRSAGH